MLDKAYQIGTWTMIVGLLLVGFQNCGQTEAGAADKAAASASVSQSEVQRRYQELRDLAAKDLRCSTAADCEAIALGDKACGGPTGYLVSSVLNESYDDIVRLAGELTEVERRFNFENQLASTCSFEMPPEVICQTICKPKP